MTFEVEHGSSIATFEATPALGGNGNVRVISPAGANMDFTTGNGTTRLNQWNRSLMARYLKYHSPAQ